MKLQPFSEKMPARASAADARNFMALYRAYQCGAADRQRDAEQEHGFKMAVAAMVFALVSWAVMLYFVFR